MDERSIEYVVIGCYLIALVSVGMVFRRFNENVSDYFRNGCKGTWWLVGSSAFMTAFSAWTFSGASGAAYEAGWSVLVIYLANSVGFAINGLFLAKWFRQIRAITAPEVIRKRFSVSTQQFYAWMSFVMQTLYSSLHLLGLAIFCSAVFGYKIEQVIVVVGLVVLLYSLVGGSWAVTATDFLQTLILIPITILVGALCLVKIGGVGALLALPMAVPTLMGLFIRTTPSWAAIVTVSVTLIPSAIGFFSAELFGETWSFQQKVFTNISTGVVVYLLTMPFWKNASASYQQQTQEFFDRMLTPIDFGKEVGVPNDLRQFKIIGSFAAVIGGLICLLVFLPNPLTGRLGILFVGGFVLAVGSAFVWLGRRSESDISQVQAAD